MEVIHGLGKPGKKFQETVTTIGAFDGIHVGHQKIIREVRRQAEKSGRRSVVVTFDPHPSEILSDTPASVLLSLPGKIDLLGEFGIEVCLIIDFDRKFSCLSPHDFVSEVLVGYLKVGVVIIGYNYVFGGGRGGNAEFLSELGSEYGFIVKQIEPVKMGGEIVSSTRIREFIRNADFVKANSFLGRPYEVAGRVEEGEARGRIIGFPTANLDIPFGLLPPPGVYAGFAVIGGKQYRAALSLGWKPTFSKTKGAKSKVQSAQSRVQSPDSKRRTLKSKVESVGAGLVPTFGDRKGRPYAPTAEVHILDFNRNIYGEELTFHFLRKIRDEITFSNPDELKRQIEKDIVEVRSI